MLRKLRGMDKGAEITIMGFTDDPDEYNCVKVRPTDTSNLKTLGQNPVTVPTVDIGDGVMAVILRIPIDSIAPALPIPSENGGAPPAKKVKTEAAPHDDQPAETTIMEWNMWAS
jgi:hypothetical protein